MTTVTQSIHIDAAPETVFDRLVDPTLVPSSITMRAVNEPTEGVGNIYEWTYRLGRVLFHGVVVYTQYVPSRRFAYESLGMVAASAVFTVEPEDGGTRLTKEVDFTVRIPLIGGMLERLMVKAAEPNAVRTVACPELVDFFIRRGVERRSGSSSAGYSGRPPAGSSPARCSQ